MIYMEDSFKNLPQKIRQNWESLYLSRDIQEEWVKVCEEAVEDYTPFYYVKTSDDDSIEGLVVGNIIKKLDCLNFVKKEEAIKNILNQREEIPDYFRYDVLFIGGPMSMEAGIYYDENSCSTFEQFFDEFQKYIFEYKSFDGIFFTNIDINNHSVTSSNTISIPYYPNTLLKLNFDDFNDYLKSLKKKKRWDIKNKKKIFKEAGCSIEIVSNSDINENYYDEFFQLYLEPVFIE